MISKCNFYMLLYLGMVENTHEPESEKPKNITQMIHPVTQIFFAMYGILK